MGCAWEGLGSVVWRVVLFFFFQAEDGIRDAQESRGLGDVYKRQDLFSLGTDGCCAARKVAVLDRVMAEKDAWMTGLRLSLIHI